MKPSRARSAVAVTEADSVAEAAAAVVTAVAEARAAVVFDGVLRVSRITGCCAGEA